MLSRFSCIQLFVTLWTIARQAPWSMGFSRQEYRSGLPYSPPGDLPLVTLAKSFSVGQAPKPVSYKQNPGWTCVCK